MIHHPRCLLSIITARSRLLNIQNIACSIYQLPPLTPSLQSVSEERESRHHLIFKLSPWESHKPKLRIRNTSDTT